MHIKIKIFYCLKLSVLVGMASHAQITQTNKFTKSCNISRKKWVMKLIFWMPINIKVFCKLTQSFSIGLFGHAQSTEISLHYLNTISKKKLEWSSFFKCRLTLKFSMIWYCHFCLLWPGMPRVPKITSFQYHRNDMLDYLDFRYERRPSHRNNSFICQWKTIKNDCFYLKSEVRDWRSSNNVHLLVLFSGSFRYLLKWGTTWSHLKPPRSYLKPPETSHTIAFFTWNKLFSGWVSPNIPPYSAFWAKLVPRTEVLQQIWYTCALLHPYYVFNVYFFKIFVLHIFGG